MIHERELLDVSVRLDTIIRTKPLFLGLYPTADTSVLHSFTRVFGPEDFGLGLSRRSRGPGHICVGVSSFRREGHCGVVCGGGTQPPRRGVYLRRTSVSRTPEMVYEGHGVWSDG